MFETIRSSLTLTKESSNTFSLQTPSQSKMRETSVSFYRVYTYKDVASTAQRLEDFSTHEPHLIDGWYGVTFAFLPPFPSWPRQPSPEPRWESIFPHQRPGPTTLTEKIGFRLKEPVYWWQLCQHTKRACRRVKFRDGKQHLDFLWRGR